MFKNIPNIDGKLSQSGFTLLELLTVIGMILVLTTFVTPVIGKWRIERNIEKDFFTLVGTIDYLKAKARVINGTGILSCSDPNKLTYSLSGFAQTSIASKHADYDDNIIETKAEKILSGKTYFDCTDGTNIFFLQNTKATSWEGVIAYQVAGITDKANYSSYKVKINSATAFIQQYKWNKKDEIWIELR